MFKITFLHDENIFLIQIYFYDLEYEPRVQENTCERPLNYTARARAQNSYFSLLFVLDVVWRPPAWWILCLARVEIRVFHLEDVQMKFRDSSRFIQVDPGFIQVDPRFIQDSSKILLLSGTSKSESK